MTEEEIKAIEFLRKRQEFMYSEPKCVTTLEESIDTLLNLIDKQQKEIDTHIETENDYEHELARKDEEIEKLKQIIKAEKIIEENLPEETEVIVMLKKDFIRNFGNDYISKDKIREKIKEYKEKYYPDVAITKLQELLEE